MSTYSILFLSVVYSWTYKKQKLIMRRKFNMQRYVRQTCLTSKFQHIAPIFQIVRLRDQQLFNLPATWKLVQMQQPKLSVRYVQCVTVKNLTPPLSCAAHLSLVYNFQRQIKRRSKIYLWTTKPIWDKTVNTASKLEVMTSYVFSCKVRRVNASIAPFAFTIY